jgi:uncharacterized protein (TIGR02996 family)
MRDEAAAFLEHIRANPTDDAPRLVYADWLDEHGQPERAAFIRIQIERAGLPKWDALQVGLSFRERALLRANLGRWRDELPTLPGVTWGAFRRGFVAAVGFGTFTALKANAAAVWAAAPVQEATVRWPRQEDEADQVPPIPGLRALSVTGTVVDMAEVELLAAAPLLGTLRELTARECDLGIGGFRRVVASPHLKKLTALRVPFNSVGSGAVGTLHRATTLPALTELDLSEVGSYGRYGEDPIVDAGAMEELAAWPGLARLGSLNLNGNDVSREGLRALLRSPFATGLKELGLRGNSLMADAVEEFGDARSGLHLESLDLGENLLRELGPRYLARSPCLRELKTLRIDRCEVPPHGAVNLSKAPFVAGLRRLDASHNGFGPFGLLALLVAAPAELHTLRLVDNDIGDAGVTHLAGSPASDVLRSIDLTANGVGDPGLMAMAGSPHLRNLVALRLGSNPTSPAAVAALKKSPLGRRLALLEATSGSVVEGEDDIPF